MADRLFRSQDDRMVAGVAGGLAEMWDADPSVVRIVWALLIVLTGGIGLVVYIVMAIVVPNADDVASYRPAPMSTGDATASATSAPATGSPAAAPDVPVPGWVAPTGWTAPSRASDRAARRQARAERHAARRARRRGPGSALAGVVLVLLGLAFLAREWLPTIDLGWVWPLLLVVLGVVLLVSAFVTRPSDDGGPH